MKKYQIAIFDLDGTILNTIEDLADSTNYVLEQFGMPSRNLEEIKRFVGNGIRKLLEQAVPAGTDEETIDRVHEMFTDYYKLHCADKTRPYDGIVEVIKKLRSKGIKTAVVSNKADYGVQALCRDYFDGLFDYAVGEKEGNRRKPYPDSVFDVLKKLNLQREDAVYIGDSDVDLATSQNAGMDVIMVGWGFRTEEFLKKCGATSVIHKPEEILDFFRFPLTVLAVGDDVVNEAKELSSRLGAFFTQDEEEAYRRGLTLRYDKNVLSLTDGSLSIKGDFEGMLQRIKPGNLQKEILIKAVRIKGEEHINVLDATAGMGEDSLILAAAGFDIKMYEQDKVIAVLLTNSIDRAAGIPELAHIVQRMEVYCEDSIEAMKKLDHRPDVILLDPMFPERHKSAMVKKKFQLLQQLESPCSNEEELMQAAIDAHPRKIVVKRPAKGPYLAGMKPSHSIGGKAVRYDCYIYC